MAKVEFLQVRTEEQRKCAGELIREYLSWLLKQAKEKYQIEFDVGAMVAADISRDCKFMPPDGRFYLVYYNGDAAGVGCLKKLKGDTGEIQRMYVLERYRGKGLGRAIANRLISDARSIGYSKLCLESLGFLDEAHALYRSLGFKKVEPYKGNSMDAYQDPDQRQHYFQVTVFMEMDLEQKK